MRALTDTDRSIRQRLCDTQSRLFLWSAELSLDSRIFINEWMRSRVCAKMDLPFSRTHWAGERWVMEEFLDESPVPKGPLYDACVLSWMGYIYRWWQFTKGTPSREIIGMATPERMDRLYDGYHTFSCDIAIDKILERNRETETAKAASLR